MTASMRRASRADSIFNATRTNDGRLGGISRCHFNTIQTKTGDPLRSPVVIEVLSVSAYGTNIINPDVQAVWFKAALVFHGILYFLYGAQSPGR